jgi:hypothetical protein
MLIVPWKVECEQRFMINPVTGDAIHFLGTSLDHFFQLVQLAATTSSSMVFMSRSDVGVVERDLHVV